MTYKKKTWLEKLENKKEYPKVLKLEKRFPCYNAVHKMGAEEGDDIILVNPDEVIEIMEKIPRGRLITIVEICKKIARNHKVQGCCSLTAGIFIMIAANATEEAIREGKDLNIPYWRTLKAEGYLNEKYPGGITDHQKLLEKEGFRIIHKGKKAYVENYINYIIKVI
jgi:6-O-methylguanine DNA methyltransferase, DNA binding domain